MFNIGGPEVLIIALVALVVVGPEQLPSVLRKAGKYAAQIRSMSNGLRQEFMAGIDELDPTKWEDSAAGKNGAAGKDGADGTTDGAKGSIDNPIVPKGYAERVAAGEPDNPFKAKPVSQSMAEPTPDEAAAEAEADALRAAKRADEAAERAARLREAASPSVKPPDSNGSIETNESDDSTETNGAEGSP